MQNFERGPVPPEVGVLLEQVKWLELGIWVLVSILGLEHRPSTGFDLGFSSRKRLVEVTVEMRHQLGLFVRSIWFKVSGGVSTQCSIGGGLDFGKRFWLGKVQDRESGWSLRCC